MSNSKVINKYMLKICNIIFKYYFVNATVKKFLKFFLFYILLKIYFSSINFKKIVFISKLLKIFYFLYLNFTKNLFFVFKLLKKFFLFPTFVSNV